MDLQATLIELAEDHLDTMRGVPWTAFAHGLRPRSTRDGETFGCEINGIYFDIGDNVRWMSKAGGDILLTCHATAPNQAAAASVERSTVIARPKWRLGARLRYSLQRWAAKSRKNAVTL